jgi:Tol biopolymer transport system component
MQGWEFLLVLPPPKNEERIEMLRVVNLKVWVALLVAGMVAATVGALFVDGPNPAHAGAFPGKNGKIAYTTAGLEKGEIYSMNPDGTNQTNLSLSGDTDQEPSYSASGKKIAFSSNRDGNYEIYTMNSNGTLQTRLTTDPNTDEQPSYSPDGKKIAFVSDRDGDREIFTMNSNGTGLKQLTNNSVGDINPAWSPGGKKIAFASNKPARPLQPPGNYQIWVMNADGTNQHQLTTATTGPSFFPSWSPSGKKIAFDSERDYPNHEIYLMNSDGSNQINLTNNSATDTYPAYSPNGKKIAFSSDRVSGYHIYTMSANGSNQARVDNGAIPEIEPSWQPLH